ncbi:MAG: hypothetical protein QN143_11040 [Armatimonadota bacterium]|nr:hypothetical protein [Armatimonadota bacterium]
MEKFPNAFQQNGPGYTLYGIFWIVSLLAGSVLQENREGEHRHSQRPRSPVTEREIAPLIRLHPHGRERGRSCFHLLCLCFSNPPDTFSWAV